MGKYEKINKRRPKILMYAIKELDQEVRNYQKKGGTQNFNYQEIKCTDCNRKLKIAQIQRKNINLCVDFACFSYYCWKCKLTYFIFKFINKNEV